MSKLLKWAENELELLGKSSGENKEEVNKGVLEIVEKFSEQGHSGFTASYSLGLISSLLEKRETSQTAAEYIDWVKSQLGILEEGDDDIQKEVNNDILDIIENFVQQGYDETNTAYALGVVKRLLSRKPLTPLTGEDSEWGLVPLHDFGQNLQQNLRCSAVFRDNYDNSTAHYIEGKVFSDDNGESWYTNRDSFVDITFPYHIPDKPEYIILEKTENETGDEENVRSTCIEQTSEGATSND